VTAQSGSLLATRLGKLLLLLLCAVQFIDVVDSSIMTVALPSIRHDLGFSVEDLQWVLSGYLVTYGGLLLLGGRAGDLLGRRPLLVAGTALFAACSLTRGLAVDAGMLVAARLGQGAGARDAAITAGFHSALLVCAFFLLAAAVIGLRATNSRGEPLTQPVSTPAVRAQVPAPELTD
jgi:MFS family permease